MCLNSRQPHTDHVPWLEQCTPSAVPLSHPRRPPKASPREGYGIWITRCLPWNYCNSFPSWSSPLTVGGVYPEMYCTCVTSNHSTGKGARWGTENTCIGMKVCSQAKTCWKRGHWEMEIWRSSPLRLSVLCCFWKIFMCLWLLQFQSGPQSYLSAHIWMTSKMVCHPDVSHFPDICFLIDNT